MHSHHEIAIRVRYHETDAQGHVHHAIYFHYFELGRTELLRVAGYDYADLERNGVFLVVTEVACRYYQPCRFGDTLRLVIETTAIRGARMRHIYHLYRDEILLAKGESTIGCVDAHGKVRRLPETLANLEATQ
ncbi:MAG: acyl-CoA thioesterase [Pirellulales bacterium]|nr:acyl-CoA thioesterase [Pirellulales bacterium]